MNAKQIESQLKEMGIREAVQSFGTYDSTPCAFLKWNDDLEVFFGFDYSGAPDHDEIGKRCRDLTARFSTENLR